MEALADNESNPTDCTGLGNCSSICSGEWCGYCKGIYMQECVNIYY